MSSQAKRFKIRHLWYWGMGFLAFLWVLLRTGTKPSRIAYPCQQAAMPLALAWSLAMIGFVSGGLFLRRFTRASAVLAVFAGTVWLSGSMPDFSSAHGSAVTSLPVWQVPNPLSKVVVMDSLPHTSGSLAAGDSTVPNSFLHDPAVDTLLLMLAAQGVYLHQTAAHPNGIVHTNDVVVIKGNFQWTSRNTTSSDRIKGLIWQILNHPDGFSGEILVCDNTQDIGTGINDNDNNSEDPNQSIVDVVNTFHAKGHPVSCLDWKSFWSVVAQEYSSGDYSNGYVYDSSTKISYPKFRSPSGRSFISLRRGVWDSVSATYDPSRLCIIDFPVLKAHSMAGATIAVKNWVGVLTTAYAAERYGSWSAMHSTYFFGSYALVARVLAATFPRLTIVDAAWTTADGPSNLQWVQNTRMLLASTDPVAASWYAAKFILTPIARYPNNTNPDRQGSPYKSCLDNWTSYLSDSAGFPCTKDSTRISVYDRGVLTQVSEHSGHGVADGFELYQNYPNPFNPTTTIKYSIPFPGPGRANGRGGEGSFVSLRVLDILGREVVTLVNEEMKPGKYERTWDASGMASGVYFYRLQAGDLVASRKLLLLK